MDNIYDLIYSGNQKIKKIYNIYVYSLFYLFFLIGLEHVI